MRSLWPSLPLRRLLRRYGDFIYCIIFPLNSNNGLLNWIVGEGFHQRREEGPQGYHQARHEARQRRCQSHHEEVQEHYVRGVQA